MRLLPRILQEPPGGLGRHLLHYHEYADMRTVNDCPEL
jgi:hypothetical protein